MKTSSVTTPKKSFGTAAWAGERAQGRLGPPAAVDQPGVEPPEVLEARRIGRAVAPSEVDDAAQPGLVAYRHERAEHAADPARLACGAHREGARRAAVGPAELGDPDARVAVAVLVHEAARLLHRGHHARGVARVRMDRECVECASRACLVHAAHEIVEGDAEPAVGDACAHHVRAGIEVPDRPGDASEQARVLGWIRSARPVGGEARLVPHLPGADRDLGQLGVREPEAAARSVAAHERGGEAAHVRVVARRIGAGLSALFGCAREEPRRVEQHGQHRHVTGGERAHETVVGEEVVAPGRALDRGPVEGLAHQPDAHTRQLVERAGAVAAGVGEGVLADDSEEAARELARRLDHGGRGGEHGRGRRAAAALRGHKRGYPAAEERQRRENHGERRRALHARRTARTPAPASTAARRASASGQPIVPAKPEPASARRKGTPPDT